MTRLESKKLYEEIYKLCIEYPEYQSNERISEFIARFIRSKYKDTFSHLELKTVTQICFLITKADRTYRKVREEKFKEQQDEEKQEIREQEEMLELGYEVLHATDINKGKTL